MITEQIKADLKSNRISQREFAAKLGVDESTLSRWLNGRRQPTKATMTALRLVYSLYYSEGRTVEHEGQILPLS